MPKPRLPFSHVIAFTASGLLIAAGVDISTRPPSPPSDIIMDPGLGSPVRISDRMPMKSSYRYAEHVMTTEPSPASLVLDTKKNEQGFGEFPESESGRKDLAAERRPRRLPHLANQSVRKTRTNGDKR